MRDLEERYRDGTYHSVVFSSVNEVENLVALQRRDKLKQFVNSTDSVFEFGVGTGLNLRYLKCARRVGHDIHPNLHEVCNRYGIEACDDLVRASGEFSVVLAHHVLEHVSDPLGVLRQLRQRVAPHGRLLIYVPFEFNRRYRRYAPDEPNAHLYSWNALTLGNLVTVAGFDVVSVRIRSYGYEQHLAKLGKIGRPIYRLGLSVARTFRPCDEIELVAQLSKVE